MSILTNEERYVNLVEALNHFYWDNQISPEETAAKLETFGNECIRLAKFIRDNGEPLDTPARTPDTAETPIPAASSICPSCGHMDGYHPEWCTADESPLP